MVYTFFDKKSSSANTSDGGVKNENISNPELAEELLKPIIKNFENRKVLSCFIDNTWGAGLVDMQLISRFNVEGFHYVLLVFSVNS